MYWQIPYRIDSPIISHFAQAMHYVAMIDDPELRTTLAQHIRVTNLESQAEAEGLHGIIDRLEEENAEQKELIQALTLQNQEYFSALMIRNEQVAEANDATMRAEKAAKDAEDKAQMSVSQKWRKSQNGQRNDFPI